MHSNDQRGQYNAQNKDGRRARFTIFKINADGTRGIRLGEVYASSLARATLDAGYFFSSMNIEICLVKGLPFPRREALPLKPSGARRSWPAPGSKKARIL